jgi:hypothetical protein
MYMLSKLCVRVCTSYVTTSLQSAHDSCGGGRNVAALQIEAAMARGLLSALRGAAARGAEIQRSRHLREDLDGKVYVS